MEQFSKKNLEDGITALTSLLNKCEKAILKLAPDAPQHTLLTRRIKALKIAVSLMKINFERAESV